MRLLITGANGFVGRHLLSRVGQEDPDVQLACWGRGTLPADTPGRRWASVDIRDPVAVRAAVGEAAPTHVCHLAAAASVGGSFLDQRGTWELNLMGTLNLLEAVVAEAPQATLLLISSSEVYGESFASGEPLGEEAPLAPMNPYAASKAACEMLARSFVRRGPRIIVMRPFNHIGPGQSAAFAISAFARQLALIEAGHQAPRLSVGNLEARRDFLDVDDVVRAYLAALSGHLESGSVLNVCSGVARRIGDVLDELIRRSGLRVELVSDPARLRPSDIPSACGRADRARRLLGWTPEVPFETTLNRVLADWRQRIASESRLPDGADPLTGP